MALTALLSFLATPELETDTPSWTPIVFAAGAFAILVIVLILVRQKLRQSESWKRDSENTDNSDDDQQNLDSGEQ